MESVAPFVAVYFAWPQMNAMLALFVLHYVNRAWVQPLRSPTRSPLHASVVISAVAFNALNGYLQGTWLRGHGPPIPSDQRPLLLALFGLMVFLVGFIGNVWHDGVLLHLRRRPQGAVVRTSTSRYLIPYGGLYQYVSYPNYLCECTSCR